MGDVADMMLDGTLCEGCGEFMGEAVGFTRYCAGCRTEANKVRPVKSKPIVNRINCPVCGRRVSLQGLLEHTRALHTRAQP